MPNINGTNAAGTDCPAEERVYTVEDVVKMVSFLVSCGCSQSRHRGGQNCGGQIEFFLM